jgi:hypothetical protein
VEVVRKVLEGVSTTDNPPILQSFCRGENLYNTQRLVKTNGTDTGSVRVAALLMGLI